QMMLPRVGGLHPISRDLASEPRQPHHPLRDGGLYDRMLFLAAAIDGDFAVDSIAQHSSFAGREGSKPRITEIGRTACCGLLVKRQHRPKNSSRQIPRGASRRDNPDLAV